jgi:hypothetical protein
MCLPSALRVRRTLRPGRPKLFLLAPSWLRFGSILHRKQGSDKVFSSIVDPGARKLTKLAKKPVFQVFVHKWLCFMSYYYLDTRYRIRNGLVLRIRIRVWFGSHGSGSALRETGWTRIRDGSTTLFFPILQCI